MPAARLAPVLPPPLDSLALTERYARIEARFLASDLLRREGGGPDAPFNARRLAENFAAIAFFSEYDRAGRAQPVEVGLSRWETPVGLKVIFGESPSDDQRISDDNAIRAFAHRLSRITGVAITPGAGPEMTVMVLGEGDRALLASRLRQTFPGLSPGEEGRILALDPETYCTLVSRSDTTGALSRTLIVIRDELPELLRLSCIHEEMSQAMGLPNDSPRARPSIFNDDEEFALLTDHDILLLRILYDPRLQAGQSLAEARPTIQTIAAELMGE